MMIIINRFSRSLRIDIKNVSADKSELNDE